MDDEEEEFIHSERMDALAEELQQMQPLEVLAVAFQVEHGHSLGADGVDPFVALDYGTIEKDQSLHRIHVTMSQEMTAHLIEELSKALDCVSGERGKRERDHP
jgi:hypothetical protein